MNEERPAVIFADGLFWERPPATAPANLRGKLSVKVDTFIEFLQKHKSERGYVNIGLWKSKNDPDKLYLSLDQWKPQPKNDSWTDDRIGTNDRTPDPDAVHHSSLEGTVEYPIDPRDMPAF